MAKKVARRGTVRVIRKPVDKDTMGARITPVKAVKRPIRRNKKS